MGCNKGGLQRFDAKHICADRRENSSPHRVRSEKWQRESSPNFLNFCPEFPPEFCSEFSPNFSRSFGALFSRKRRPEKKKKKTKNKSPKIPALFQCQIPRQLRKNYSQNVSGAPVRFGSVTVRGWNGSSGSGFRFRRFLCRKGFSVFQQSLTGKDGSGSWKTVLAVPVPLSVPTVPVPCPSFPCSFGIPCFFPCEKFLVFLSVFPFFSRDFRGSVGTKNPCFLLVFFRAFFQKKEGKEGQGSAFGFGEKRFRRFRFPVPVLVLSHPAQRLFVFSKITILATSYRSAKAPSWQKCRKSASETAGPKRDAEESAEKALRASSLVSASTEARSPKLFFGGSDASGSRFRFGSWATLKMFLESRQNNIGDRSPTCESSISLGMSFVFLFAAAMILNV